jgi:protein gp37
MADRTKIEWTDATWNPITGCSLISEGCRNCYAAELAASRLKNTPERFGLAKRNAAGVAQFTGKVRFNEKWLDQPLRWRKRRRIFVCAHADLFHENVPDAWIDRIFAVMALCPQHTFQVLTKRPERMRAYLSCMGSRLRIDAQRKAVQEGRGVNIYAFYDVVGSPPGETRGEWAANWPLPNLWAGVSIEDQPTADTRIPYLLQTPAAVRFVSAEPLLGPLSLRNILKYNAQGRPWIDALRGLVTRGQYLARSPSECSFNTSTRIPGELPGLDWVIVGGESGRRARPMHPAWVRRIRDDCAVAGVPFLFKQWGAWLPRSHAEHLGDEINDLPLGEFHTPDGEWMDACMCSEGAADMPMFQVGKGAAGRLLDGVAHDAFPATGRAA